MARVVAWVGAHGYAASSRSLSLYRILFAAGVLLMVTPTTAVPLHVVPDSLYHPPLGPMMLFGGWPDEPVLIGLELAVQLLLVALVFGAFTRTTSLSLAALGAVLAGFRYADGKIDHEFIIVVAVPLIMAFTSWGHHWSVDARRTAIRRRADFRAPATWQLFALALTIGASYATSGVAKAATGWLEMSGSASRGWLVAYLEQYRWAPNPFNLALATVQPLWFWKALDASTVLFEVGMVVAALRRRWFVRFLCLAVVFHLVVFLVFSINFSRLLLVYLAFLRMDRVADWLRLDVTDRLRSPLFTAAAVATGGWIGWRFIEEGGPVRLLRWVASITPLDNGLLIPGIVLGVVGVRALVLWLRTGRPWVREASASPTDRPWVAPTVLATVAVLLVGQLGLLALVSEPYPAPTGPLFMGNRDRAEGVVVHRQTMAVEIDGERHPTRAVHVLPVRSSNVTNLRQVRFPLPLLNAEGTGVVEEPSRRAQLAWMGHRFSSAHLTDYDGELAPDTAAWIRRGLGEHGITCGSADSCELVVAWTADVIDPRTREHVEDAGHLLERRRWDLRPEHDEP